MAGKLKISGEGGEAAGDLGEAAAGAEAAADAGAADAGLDAVDVGADAAEAGAEALNPAPKPVDGAADPLNEGSAALAEAVADLKAQRDAALQRADQAQQDAFAAHERADKAEAEVKALVGAPVTPDPALAEKDKAIAELTAERDRGLARVAELEALLADEGAVVTAQGDAPDVKRPRPGKVLTIPPEGKRATFSMASAWLADGGLTVVVLTDDRGAVQPYPALVGGQSLFTTVPSGLTCNAPIELTAEMERMEVRHAVLLASDGTVLTACRLGALLLGGGGLSALIPANNLLFTFD